MDGKIKSNSVIVFTAACQQAEQEFFKAVEKEKMKLFPKLYKRKGRKNEDGIDGEEELSDGSDGSLVSE